MRYLIAIILMLTLGCGYATRQDPVLYFAETQESAREQAEALAKTVKGYASQNLCCGSMKPTITTGDWIVIKKTEWNDKLLGKVVNYAPQWYGNIPIVHRLVSGDSKNGFIASGDNNAHSEPYEKVTEGKFVGEVLAIFRVKQ